MPFLNTDTEGGTTLHFMTTAGGQTTLRPNVFFVGTSNLPTFSITAGGTTLIVAGEIYNTANGNAISIATNTNNTDIIVAESGFVSASSNSTIRATGGGVLSIANYGTIQGRSTVINTLDSGGLVTRLDMFNTGTIVHRAGSTAVLCGSANDFIVNAGTIIGNVELRGGFNYFDTHRGTVTGTIFAGVNDDSYVISGRERIIDEGGYDVVSSHGDYTLANGLEELNLRGTASFAGGNAGNNVLRGNITASRLNGRDGNDLILGQNDDDIGLGGAGDDQIELGRGANQAFGGAGDDLIAAGQDAELLDGGTGTDTLSLVYSSAGVVLDLATGAVSGGFLEGDTIRGFETVIGSIFSDRLTGAGAENVFYGALGDDVLNGAGGNDILNGGEGADSLDGGSGVDGADYGEALTGVTVDLTLGFGSGGEAQGDTYVSIENVLGGINGDTLIGSATGNLLRGGGGNDVLSGRGGGDVLEGGRGNDNLTGGAGADVFLFADHVSGVAGGWNSDVITDFQDGQDRISFLGDTGVTSFASLSFSSVGGGTLITTGAGDTILLSGIALAALDASDFIFG